MPNRLVFSSDGETLYLTDSSAAWTGFHEPTADLRANIMYAFDRPDLNDVVRPHDTPDVTHSLRNRQIFAHIGTGIADSFKTDNYDDMGNGYRRQLHLVNCVVFVPPSRES